MIVGSHGAEHGDAAVPATTLSSAATRAIESLAARWPGLLVETKPHGFAIHYRQEPDAEAAGLPVMDGIAEREGLRSAESRVGKACVSTCRSRCTPET